MNLPEVYPRQRLRSNLSRVSKAISPSKSIHLDLRSDKKTAPKPKPRDCIHITDQDQNLTVFIISYILLIVNIEIEFLHQIQV